LIRSGWQIFLSRFTVRFLADPAASQYAVGVVKNGGLAGGDGALRRVKDDACGGGVESFHGGKRRFVFVADFYLGSNRRSWHLARDPIHGCDFAGGFVQGLVFADYNTICLRIDAQDIQSSSG
jgi:hypothetical protein